MKNKKSWTGELPTEHEINALMKIRGDWTVISVMRASPNLTPLFLFLIQNKHLLFAEMHSFK